MHKATLSLFNAIQVDKKKKAKDKAKIPEAATTPEFLKTGRYSFQEIGNKIQDVFLKDPKKDLAQKQVDIAQLGLAKQDEQLKATKALKPSGIGP